MPKWVENVNYFTLALYCKSNLFYISHHFLKRFLATSSSGDSAFVLRYKCLSLLTKFTHHNNLVTYFFQISLLVLLKTYKQDTPLNTLVLGYISCWISFNISNFLPLELQHHLQAKHRWVVLCENSGRQHDAISDLFCNNGKYGLGITNNKYIYTK